ARPPAAAGRARARPWRWRRPGRRRSPRRRPPRPPPARRAPRPRCGPGRRRPRRRRRRCERRRARGPGRRPDTGRISRRPSWDDSRVAPFIAGMLSLRFRLLLPVLAVVLAGAVYGAAAVQRSTATSAAKRLQTAQALLTGMLDQETGLRGY